ncbi:uncharacterized protein LOC120943665 isoform X2 [Rana temporaria]|uniref:uncharacterized protein LOC120943665 isoform X2 n=1 Tax=Rana temporaria TaxID=8407 RepID=UPI001AADAD3E|nr:uncharacterized protein LOC120943665 isoform X2 [Rana temporaria]
MIDSSIPKCELNDVTSAAKEMSQDNPQPKKSTVGSQDRSSSREKKSLYSNIGLHTENRNRQTATQLIPIVDTCRIETTLAQIGENKVVNTSRKAAVGHRNIKRRANEDNDISDFERELMNEKHHRKKKPLDPRHRLRNAKFTAQENLVLVENLIPVFHKLAGNNLATTDPAWKHAAWLKITAAVNSLGVYPRHHEHVKKRFHDIKFALRKKMSDEQQSRRSGVGILGNKIFYHDYEELLKPYIYKESFIGIDGGYDSSKHIKGTVFINYCISHMRPDAHYVAQQCFHDFQESDMIDCAFVSTLQKMSCKSGAFPCLL